MFCIENKLYVWNDNLYVWDNKKYKCDKLDCIVIFSGSFLWCKGWSLFFLNKKKFVFKVIKGDCIKWLIWIEDRIIWLKYNR